MASLNDPQAIAATSFQIIREQLGPVGRDEEEREIIYRVVHATGDLSWADLVAIGPGTVAAGRAALRSGPTLVTDVEMVRAGINAGEVTRRGGCILCAIRESGVAGAAAGAGITRAMAAMDLLAPRLAGAVVIVGNAPTALRRILELSRAGYRPALVVGTPVGFVGAAEAKEELMASDLPWITARGTRGGSTVAVAITNALLQLSHEVIKTG